eukprot:COSAG06_NODE_12573_length_1361_cov_63.923930_2_plen_58_part_00
MDAFSQEIAAKKAFLAPIEVDHVDVTLKACTETTTTFRLSFSHAWPEPVLANDHYFM